MGYWGDLKDDDEGMAPAAAAPRPVFVEVCSRPQRAIPVTVLRSHASAAALTVEIQVGEHKVFVSFHGGAVVAQGWQPFDQPSPSAYVPKSRDELTVIEGAGGELLVSKETH